MKKIITAAVIIFSVGLLTLQTKVSSVKANTANLPKPGLFNYRKELAGGD